MTELRLSGDVCEEVGVTARALRVWEEQGLLTDVVRNDRGFRMYDPHQIEIIKAIAVGQLVGLTLSELKAIAKNWNVVEERKMRYRVKDLIQRLNFLVPQEQEYDL